MVLENKSRAHNEIEFKHKIVDKKLTSITVDVEVSDSVAVNELENAFNQIRQQVKLDGFRQGKVPLEVVKSKFAEEAKNRAVENIIKKSIPDVLAKENFIPIDYPVVEEFNYEAGQILKYRFTAECHPKIEVNDYKGIPIIKDVFRVTDESLAQTIDAIRKRKAMLIPSDSDIVTDRSFVSVDYAAFDANGGFIAGVEAKNYLIDLNSPQTLSGFKTALKGEKIGAEKEVKIEYPQDYPNKSLAGKTVVFKTKINEIKVEKLPELDDDFAKDIGLKDVEELKNKARETIEDEEKRRQDIDVEDKIIKHLLEKNKFGVPQGLVAKQKESLIEKMRKYLREQGVAEEYVEKQIKERSEKFEEEAERAVRLSYILNEICDRESLAVTDADIEKEKERVRSLNSSMGSAVDKYFEKNKENIAFSLREKKLFGFLIEKAEIKTVEKDMPLKKEE
jgi:trigger factor